MIRADHLCLSGGGDEHLRPAALGGQIGGAGVAEGDGGVAPQQQHGRRSADHQAAANHHRPPAGEIISIVVQQLHAGLGGAGGIALPVAGEHRRQRAGCDAVHILGRREGGTHRALVHVAGQWAEQQAAVDIRRPVDLPEQRCQLLLGGILRQDKPLDSNAHLLAPLHGPPLIGQILRPLPHPDNGQGGNHAGLPQGGGLDGQLLRQGRRRRRALPQLCHQENLPMTAS